MQPITVSKSELKPKLLHYLRLVEEKGQPINITHHKKVVAQILPNRTQTDEEILASLRGSIKIHGNIMEPVGLDDWEALK